MTVLNRAAQWRAARNVLAVRLDTIGDVLMTTPALRALRESTTGRRITLLTSAIGAEAARLVPEVDDVIVYDAPWLKATVPRPESSLDLAMIERLRSERFDAAVVFTVYSQNPLPSAMLCYLADIPLRLAHCHENPYQLLTDWIPDPEPGNGARHEVRRQLDLVGAVGCKTDDDHLAIRIPAEAWMAAAHQLAALGIDEEPWVLMHVGASAPSRRYPPVQFAEAADQIVKELGCPVVLSGGRDEQHILDEVRAAMQTAGRAVSTTLGLTEFAAVISAARLLVSNNSGPVHIAAAVGTPVVDLYALTNPQHTPWQVPHRVLFHDVSCRWCYKSICPQGHHDCLRLLSSAEIVNAAAELLAPRRPSPATHLASKANVAR